MNRPSFPLRLLKYLIPVAVVLSVLTLLRQENQQDAPTGQPRDYAAIEKEGVLRVATEYNSIGFHVTGDTLTGFHYDLIQAFAKAKKLQTVITPVMSFSDRLKGLNEGKFDLIATHMLATSEWKDSLLLTSPIVRNRQVLVQRKAAGEQDTVYISNQLQLAKRTVHVVKSSPSILRIRNLSNEIGDTIYIKEIDKYGPEQLIALVAHGDIDYAVCEESIARIVADSLPQIDIDTAISFTQFYSWAVSKQSPALLDTLNTWLNNFKQEKAYRQLYQKYYPSSGR